MLEGLPSTSDAFQQYTWDQIEPFYQELEAYPLSPSNAPGWLSGWTRLSELFHEAYQRLHVAVTCDTTNTGVRDRYNAFLENIYPHIESRDNRLRNKLLASGAEPAGLEVPLRNMRQEAEIFREENIPLLTEERKLSNEYATIIGAQTVEWEGKERTLKQLAPIYQDPNRDLREKAWRLEAGRQAKDKDTINALWVKLLTLRKQLAANAGFSDYRAYRWKTQFRFDYTPEDCLSFHKAIEEVVVPVANRLYEKRRQQLGVKTLRPWDLSVDPLGRESLKPFADVKTLENGAGGMFRQVDGTLGQYYQTMRDEGLLDLENRKGKAPGGYCTSFAVRRRPFIFMNAVGLHDDVQTLMHEAGHAFHVFESAGLPYIQQHEVGMEFAEVASMSMELLAAPYLDERFGGYYSAADTARARAEHLEDLVIFWPYMAVVDAFQHWVYTHMDEAMDPARCDKEWTKVWRRFRPPVDYSGLEENERTGWHRKLHIFQYPFYYVEYGLAQLGAVQVWRNSLKDEKAAVQAYRKALSFGGTKSLPELFATAGARFAFDSQTLREAVELAESQIAVLEGV